MIDLRCGNNLDLLPTLADCSVDACVCDPPYELGFMGKKWDSSGIAYSVDLWRQVLRVLKPGGHLIAFGGTRTYHRMTCAIEDAGFEVRDCLGWLYGSGFPKSLDVAKGFDRHLKVEQEVVGTYLARGFSQTSPTNDGRNQWAAGQVIDKIGKRTRPTSEQARQWQGWGTALKPAWEPAVLARKPLDGTVVANVLAHGCGALNVDGCRVDGEDVPEGRTRHGGGIVGNASSYELPDYKALMPAGRWPANILHDGSDQAEAVFPDDGNGSASRFFYSAKTAVWERETGLDDLPRKTAGELVGRTDGSAGMDNPRTGAGRTSAGRANIHPTVKPVDLMRWLVRLVTPPGGTVLDPFTGSGSTGMAAMLEGFGFVGFELDPQHVEIARRRIDAARHRTIVVKDGKVAPADAPQNQQELPW